MLSSINISHVFVFDQDKALDFYVGKLGLEVSNDMDLGFMRWLTVRVPGDPTRDILLELPGTEHFYGTDFGLRDPFGNHMRITQLAPTSHQLPAKQAEKQR